MELIKAFGIMCKLTKLQKNIINYMENMSSFNLWGFSALGYREYAILNKLKPISVSNAMRSLLNKGIFYRSHCKDMYSDTIYFLKNDKKNECNNSY